MFTTSSVLAETHACAPPAGEPFADTFRSIMGSIFRNTVDGTILPNADKPMSIYGMSWPVALTGAPASVMLGPVETDTAVAFGERIRQGEEGE
jgi:hypothetical protein